MRIKTQLDDNISYQWSLISLLQPDLVTVKLIKFTLNLCSLEMSDLVIGAAVRTNRVSTGGLLVTYIILLKIQMNPESNRVFF